MSTPNLWPRRICLLAAATLCTAVRADVHSPFAKALTAAEPIFESRLRVESVEQAGMLHAADAVTMRARLGFETGKLWGTALLAEGELVGVLDDHYNSTTNDNTSYPVVADPESAEVNRLQLTNTTIPLTAVVLGRQRIVLDDQRFVGNVGWRQNEQTFDSLRIVNRGMPGVTLDAAYVRQVNRVFGAQSSQGRYHGESLLANASYQSAMGKLTAFAYRVAIEPIAEAPSAVRDSSQTFGLRFAGQATPGPAKLTYSASYARQRESANNPLSFDLDYYFAEANATYRNYSLGIGAEILEGDTLKGFTTPLATLHKFQGWADKFLATPANGIDDRYLSAGFVFKHVGSVDALSAVATCHRYVAEHGSLDYGSEVDLQLQATWGRVTGTLKYARYDADRLLTDTAKVWAQVEYTW